LGILPSKNTLIHTVTGRKWQRGVKTKNPVNIGVYEVFCSKKMVGAEGIEPSTFWSRNKRTNHLIQ